MAVAVSDPLQALIAGGSHRELRRRCNCLCVCSVVHLLLHSCVLHPAKPEV